MSSVGRARTARCLAVVCLVSVFAAGTLVGPASSASAATGSRTRKKTASSKKPPVYEFLRKSGFSKRARPESAVVSGVITVKRRGRTVVTSTTRGIHNKEVLNKIQTAIINGSPVEVSEEVESTKVGKLDITYNNGKTLTVTIYNHYYEIAASAGTMHFTSEPLTTILRELLK